jgi:lipoteichoic acid synthase
VQANGVLVKIEDRKSYLYQVVFTSILAWLCLVGARYKILTQSNTGDVLIERLSLSGIAALPDLAFIGCLAVACLIFLLLFRKNKSFRIALAVWQLLIALVILAGFGNILAVRFLGEPFTYQWLVYSDFLNGNDVKAAMRGTVDWRLVAAIAALVVIAIVGGAIIGNAVGRLRATRATVTSTAGLIAVILGGLAALQTIFSTPIAAASSANPIVAFAQSLLVPSVPNMLSIDGTQYAQDFENAGERRIRSPEQPERRDPRIQNVLIFVMESTPAKALPLFGAEQEVTPHLTSYASGAQLFSSIYAHTPATNYSLFSLLTSMYPEVSYYGITASHPFAPFTSIGNVLQSSGFRTGMFWSNDKRFQRFDEFIRNKGFDVFQDFRERNCDEVFATSTEKTLYMDYGSDRCTVDSTLDWINREPSKPFLAVIATAATHYPYKTSGTEEKLADEPLKNSFLNALKVTDEAFGRLMDGLRASGKLDSTLVVVLGDHGEAFGEHGQWGHATAIYDENVHIPLLFINSSLFQGATSKALGGVIDVPATILDILGIKIPDQWQGRSLFASERPPRVYFFSPWNGFLLGYREDNRSLIFNAATGQVSVFDLGKDPGQKTDIRNSIAKSSDEMVAPLAYLVQHQNKLVASMVAGEKEPTAECKLSKIDFTAGGTEFQGKPVVELFIDGQNAGTTEIQGVASTHSDSPGIRQEVSEAMTRARSYSVTVPEQGLPHEIKLRFTNDLWMDGPEHGDRNVVITDLSVNGHRLPMEQMTVAEGDNVGLSWNGATLYQESAIKFGGPFVPGCDSVASQ